MKDHGKTLQVFARGLMLSSSIICVGYACVLDRNGSMWREGLIAFYALGYAFTKIADDIYKESK